MANNKGTATIDFGSSGSSDAKITVSGAAATGITTGSSGEAWKAIEATSDHTADEAMMEDIDVAFDRSSIVANTSFDIRAHARNGRAVGRFNVDWVWTT